MKEHFTERHSGHKRAGTLSWCNGVLEFKVLKSHANRRRCVLRCVKSLQR